MTLIWHIGYDIDRGKWYLSMKLLFATNGIQEVEKADYTGVKEQKITLYATTGGPS
jgi:hypothetical protein